MRMKNLHKYILSDMNTFYYTQIYGIDRLIGRYHM